MKIKAIGANNNWYPDSDYKGEENLRKYTRLEYVEIDIVEFRW